MKVWTVLRESARVYVKNFFDLMAAYLMEAVLRAMCLAPLMFLLLPETAALAWLCVPLYVLIALPARQNYALAMQDMLNGGRVFSVRLISLKGYWRKLGRGLLGMLKMACWMALPAAAVMMLYQLYIGQGALAAFAMHQWGYESMDGLSVMRWLGNFGDGAVAGLTNLLLATVALFVLPVIGCAVHCGNRHAAALEDKKLLRGCRMKLIALWVLGFAAFLPFAAAALTLLMSDLKTFILGFAQMFMTRSIVGPELGEKLYLLAAIFVLLFVTVVPFKQLIPAVAVHTRMKAAYPPLAAKTERADDAQA